MISEKHDIKKIDEFIHTNMKLSVSIHLIGYDYTFNSNVVGLKDKKYLIIDMPPRVVEDLFTCKVNNAEIIVRGISQTDLAHIIAIKSKITLITSKPYWLIHIQLPNQFETVVLRQNKRFKVDIPVVISDGNSTYDAVMKDISDSGCGFCLYDVTDNFKANTNITITSKLCKHVDEPLICTISNVRKMEKKRSLAPYLQVSPI
ncbi:PilZ domain-containing protein [Vibrio metschnikovii]|nr:MULTISPECIES: PilZ domain-containing protein [Vibrio]EKO3599705.1 PilZ domain-containing protein [Vibrio metschnikovii]EGR0489732.1 flagellar brake protein [Vibrio cholerae]EGR0589852.1 flagellar brake protein [Vibrio cholerae]EGR4406472.1 PilZ domain-containing protein [Vibrio cholerae]EII5634786.1 PilZ domain-containing protein [Vibrio cholerae]